MKVGGKVLAAAVVAMGLVAPATANASVFAKIKNDGGTPVQLTEGTPLGLTTMDTDALVNTDEGKAFSSSMTGPDGQPTGISVGCGIPGTERTNFGEYHGNGTYTLTVKVYSDKCDGTLSKTATFTWTVTAGVQIGAPAPTLLTRLPNSFSTITQQFNFVPAVGTTSYEIKYAKGATLNPDGSLNSPALKDGFFNRTTGKVELIGIREAGAYTVVARAQKGSYYSPWSPPASFNMIVPFDITSRSFPDFRGPSYQVRATLGDAAAAGSRVTVAIAKGKKGKRFRTLGKPKINSKGQVTLRFRLSRGTYRMRYSFKGNSVMARGTVYDVIVIKRVIG